MADTFRGYRRPDGSAAVRNHVLVMPTVVCANGVIERLDRELPGLALVTHQHGCAQVGDDHELTASTMTGFACNPNVGAVVLVSLGCESNQPEEIAAAVEATGRRVEMCRIQECGGITKTYERVAALALAFQAELAHLKQQPIGIEELVVGLECGGSDAWSGITANPALGVAADRLVDAGSTAILAETPEIIGAEHLLAGRAVTTGVADELLAIVEAWEAHARHTGVDARGAQPTPGNQEGGLTTIEEKSLGAIQKAGTSALTEIVSYGVTPSRRGLVFMDTPGQDIEQVTGFAAGGAHLVCFTTGRGTPTGCPVLPVIKIATNSRTASMLEEHIDVNAGRIVDGSATLDEVGAEIFDLIVEVAGGRQTAAEIGRHREFAIPRRWSSL